MPVVTVTLMEGYEEAIREDLADRLTRAVQGAIDAPPDGITVLIHELPPANYMRGGIRRTPGPPSLPAVAVVRSFLDAMEARDLEAASGCLAEGFTMTFPGSTRFTTLEQLVDWAKDRYQSVAKSYEHFDDVVTADGVVVYCFGTLSGVWLDGTAFDGIRFIDRFTVAGGKLVDQQVWNDLAETRSNLG